MAQFIVQKVNVISYTITAVKNIKTLFLLLTALNYTGCESKNPFAQQVKTVSASTPAPIIARYPKVDCEVTKCVAITFDDGPDKYTLQYLKVLKVPATFFVVGKNVKAKPNIVKEISDQGHQVCNHSWNHANLAKLSSQAVDDQIQKTDDAITAVIGDKYKPCFRFPYGSVPRNFFKTHPNLLHIAWTSDSQDWRYKDSKIQYSNVMKLVPANGVLLFHDVHPGALKTAPRVISDLQKKGFTFVTIDELNLKKGQLNMGQKSVTTANPVSKI
jgi:peptidoglycan-N-acetylglucosamine deacetylase